MFLTDSLILGTLICFTVFVQSIEARCSVLCKRYHVNVFCFIDKLENGCDASQTWTKYIVLQDI